MEEDEAAPSTLSSAEFTVAHQEVEIDVNFATQSLSGHTAITIQPLTKELKAIRLNCRQISVKNITVDGLLPQSTQYHDPYEDLSLRPSYDVHQHHLIHDKLQSDLKSPPDGELVITLPKKVKITELDPQDLRTTEDGGAIYKTITVDIYYTVKDSRDGLHWVGLREADPRHPHVYTRSQNLSHEASCYVFPCVDSFSSRSTWKITILCSRTLRDIVTEPEKNQINGLTNGSYSLSNGDLSTLNGPFPRSENIHVRTLSEEEMSLELSVVCSGYMEESDVSDYDIIIQPTLTMLRLQETTIGYKENGFSPATLLLHLNISASLSVHLNKLSCPISVIAIKMRNWVKMPFASTGFVCQGIRKRCGIPVLQLLW